MFDFNRLHNEQFKIWIASNEENEIVINKMEELGIRWNSGRNAKGFKVDVPYALFIDDNVLTYSELKSTYEGRTPHKTLFVNDFIVDTDNYSLLLQLKFGTYKVAIETEEQLHTVLEILEQLDFRWRAGEKPTRYTPPVPCGLRFTNGRISFSNFNYDDEKEYYMNDRRAEEINLSIFTNDYETIECPHCGSKVISALITEFDGEQLCSKCLNEQTTVCDDCGERHWYEFTHHSGSRNLCDNCFENYTYCADCNELICIDNAHRDDWTEEYYCSYCWDRRHRAIHDYGYKPEPIFYGDGNFYLGVELEIDGAGEDNDYADELRHIMNDGNEKIYCKHDGSLHDGFEIVSHPATLEKHKTFNWKDLMLKALDLGYRSHDAETCGLHIHINRDGFGIDYEEQEQGIAKVVHFVEKHWEKLKRFSRRTDYQLEEWARRYGLCESVEETYKNAKDENDGSRYVCVNLLPSKTIEFRFFRGTLNYTTFMATLQLVNEICNYCLKHTDKEIEHSDWNEFLSMVSYTELINYLEEKNLI